MDEFYCTNGKFCPGGLSAESDKGLEYAAAALNRDAVRVTAIMNLLEMAEYYLAKELKMRKQLKTVAEEVKDLPAEQTGKYVWIANSGELKPYPVEVKGILKGTSTGILFVPTTRDLGAVEFSATKFPGVVRNLLKEGCDIYFSVRYSRGTFIAPNSQLSVNYFLFRPAT